MPRPTRRGRKPTLKQKYKYSLSVILPAFNEEESLLPATEEIIDYLDRMFEDYEVIIVNDGSIDQTGKIADQLAGKYPQVKVIHHSSNIGYGSAIKSGFEAASKDLYFFTDSDRQFQLSSLEDLLPHIDRAPIVIGHRINRQDPFMRRFLSWGYNILVRFLFGIKVSDIDCAFKLFRKEVFDKIKIKSERYMVNTEILAKAQFFGYRVKEIGVEHLPRSSGVSKIRPSDVPASLEQVLRIWKLMQKLKQSHTETED